MVSVEWLYALSASVFGAFITMLILKARHSGQLNAIQQELQVTKENLEAANTRVADLQQEKTLLLEQKARLEGSREGLEHQNRELKDEEANLKQQIIRLQEAHTQLNAEKASLQTEIKKHNEWKTTLEVQWKQQLESFLLANLKTVKEDAEGEYQTRQKAIEEKVTQLLKPLSEAVMAYKKSVEEVNKEQHTNKELIGEQLKQLVQATSRLSSALTLNKGRGDWGEIELRRLLEDSGMQEGISFHYQSSLENRKRPDFRIVMPGNRVLFVDSKALQFDPQWFEDNDTTPDAQKERQKKFVRSLRQAVSGLNERDYQSELRESAGFVVLYVPREAMLSNALMLEPGLFEEAYAKKIILAGPLNLMAILKAVEHSWTMAQQSQRALKVLDEAQKLYIKSLTFVQRFDAIGKGLQTTINAYQGAITAFEGHGGMIGRLQSLEKLGCKHKDKLLEEITHVDFEHQPLKSADLITTIEPEIVNILENTLTIEEAEVVKSIE